MRISFIVLVVIFLFGIGMLLIWAGTLRHSAKILEVEYPSDNIGHSREKKTFIDSLNIVWSDTIKVKDSEIWLYPVESWLEKKSYWKSGAMDLDSIGYLQDTVIMVINFAKTLNGKPWRPRNSGSYVCELVCLGKRSSIYVDDEKAQVDFSAHRVLVEDSIELLTFNNEKILIKRRHK